MAKIPDRVKETSTTTGTGTYSLDGAEPGFRGFVAAVGDGLKCYYCAQMDSDWEVGIGTVTDGTPDPDTLSRTKILASSNAGAAVDWAAGEKTIFVTYCQEAGKVFVGSVGPTSAASVSLTIPANTLITDGDALLIFAVSSGGANDGNSTQLRWGGSGGTSLIGIFNSSSSNSFTLLRRTGSSSQHYLSSGWLNGGSGPYIYSGTTALDLTQNQDLYFDASDGGGSGSSLHIVAFKLGAA